MQVSLWPRAMRRSGNRFTSVSSVENWALPALMSRAEQPGPAGLASCIGQSSRRALSLAFPLGPTSAQISLRTYGARGHARRMGAPRAGREGVALVPVLLVIAPCAAIRICGTEVALSRCECLRFGRADGSAQFSSAYACCKHGSVSAPAASTAAASTRRQRQMSAMRRARPRNLRDEPKN